MANKSPTEAAPGCCQSNANLCMANSYLLLRCGFLKTSIAADILGFEVALAKQFIRPGQVLRYVAAVRTLTHLTRISGLIRNSPCTRCRTCGVARTRATC
jgi:hypothetical protein